MGTCYYSKIISLIDNCGIGQPSTVIIPTDIQPEIKNYTKGKLKFGLKEKEVNFLLGQRADVIELSQDIIEELGIYENLELCAKFQDNMLSLGPVIGIFMNDKIIKRLAKGSPPIKIIQTVKAAKYCNAFVYFFTIDDIIWAKHSVNATIYNYENNLWENKEVPLPDVLYDRGGGFNNKSLVKAIYIRKQLDFFTNLKKINAQHYFNKWDLYCKLSRHRETKTHLPETVLYNNDIKVLQQMIDKHSTVYLKSLDGNNGKEVMRVKKLGPSEYEYDYFKEKVIRENVDSLSDIAKVAQKFMNNKRYIIQQGIDVLTYQNNKVDLRVLVQRDGKGKWQITSMPVRIATNNCPVTSTKSGSNVYQFEDAFCNILKFDCKEVDNIKKNIYKLIDTTVNVIEEEYGTFGEIGIDIAIDNSGNLWFIESNAKPGKDTILIAGPEEDIEKAFLRPFEYAKYLSGFQNEKGTKKPFSYYFGYLDYSKRYYSRDTEAEEE